MENYVVSVYEEKQHVESMFKLSFRCTCDDDEQLMIWYINNFNNWINSKDLELVYCTMGIHRDTGNIHFHYHTVVMGKEFKKSYQSNPITLFMRDYKIGTIKTIHTLGVSPYKEVYQQKYGTKSNLSIKHKFMDGDESTITYLQYPLKEGSTIYSINKIQNLDVDLDQLIKNAQAEYRVAKRKAEKFKEKKIKCENSWAELVEYLDKVCNDTSFWRLVFQNVLWYYKEQGKKPPTFRKMENDADAYCFYRQLPGFTPKEMADAVERRRNPNGY